MKRLFLTVIFFYWVTTVFVPIVYTVLFGLEYENMLAAPEYRMKAAVIMTSMLFLASILIFISNGSNDRLEPIIFVPNRYTEVVTIGQIFLVFILGGGSLSAYAYINWSGQLNGTLINYIELFIEIVPLIIIRLLSENNNKELFAIVLYVLYTVSKSSRSGVMYVVLFYLCMRIASSKCKGVNVKRLLLVGIGSLSAPFIYFFTSNNRGFDYSDGKVLLDRIIQRLSCLDCFGRAVQAYELKDYNITLFNEKYSFWKQLRIFINTLVPGDIFESDVWANQYHRSIFSDYTIEWSQTNYMSINLTLPGYLLLKYSVPIAIVLGAVIIYLLYRICDKYKNYNVCRVVAVMGLWELLYFFDWTFVFVRIERIIFTVFAYYEYRKIKETGCIEIGKYRFRLFGKKGQSYVTSQYYYQLSQQR